MIYAYAIEPAVAAAWSRRSELRFIRDKFGLGTPRVMLELPKFSKWRKAVYNAAEKLQLTELEKNVGLAEVFRVLSENRARRPDCEYDGTRPWIENALSEFARHPFEGIIAMMNASGHAHVLITDQLGHSTDARWDKPISAVPNRSPEKLANAVRAMLENCREVQLIDPYFGPGNKRHRVVLEALLSRLVTGRSSPVEVTVHCGDKKSGTLEYFETEAQHMARRIPTCVRVRFLRWRQREGGDRFHNRYILTDLGGVTFGTGLDEGREEETEDVNLMDRKQYLRRLAQFSAPGDALELVDEPAPVQGQKTVG